MGPWSGESFDSLVGELGSAARGRPAGTLTCLPIPDSSQ